MFYKLWIRIRSATLTEVQKNFKAGKVSFSYQQNLHLRPFIKDTHLTPWLLLNTEQCICNSAKHRIQQTCLTWAGLLLGP
jgi:hypothetical protein